MTFTSVIAAAGTALAFLVGIVGHEFVTHTVAAASGDRTPRLHQRLTTSLKAQADPLGSYILPAIFAVGVLFGAGLFLPPFGWGRRHSINPQLMREQKRALIFVALSGPLFTGILAVVSGAAARGVIAGSPEVGAFLGFFALVCAGLTVFELLPIPGRDGGRVLGRFLSPRAAYKMEELAEYDVLFIIGLYTLLLPLTSSIFEAGCRTLTKLC